MPTLTKHMLQTAAASRQSCNLDHRVFCCVVTELKKVYFYLDVQEGTDVHMKHTASM